MSVVIPANATQVSILQVANGGTGEADAADAINALVPTQTGQSGKFLGTNGTVASWQAAGAAGSVTAINGTTDEIDVVTTGTVAVVSMDAAYIGQASITTVGTIATGTWQGTAIGTGYLPASQTQLTTAANLVTVGTIGTGAWHGTLIGPTYGGTGVNNGAFTITLAGNLSTSGAYATTLTATGITSVTLPTSGTLATTSQLPAGANPSGSVGLSAVNGSSTSFLRADGAPVLSQAITPTWTGSHIFQPTSGLPISVIVSGSSGSALECSVSSGAAFDIYIGAGAVAVGTNNNYPMGLYVNDGSNALTCPTAGGIEIAAGLGINGNTPASQSTGWGTPTGGSVVSNFAAGASPSLLSMSEAVAQIIIVLKQVGILGA